MVQGEGVPYRGNAGQRLCERQTEGEESKGNAKSSPVTANRQLFPRALTETLKLKHIFEKSTTLTLSKYSKRRKLGPKISYVNSYHWMCEITMRTRVKQAERAGEHKMRLRRIQCDSRSEREYTHFPGVSCGSVAVSVYERKCALKMSLFLFD